MTPPGEEPGAGNRGRQLWLLLLVFWVGWNLRAPLLSVPPVLDLVRRGEHLSYAGSGLLSAVPILALGLVAVPAAVLVRRWGARLVVGGGLCLAALGALARGLPGGALPLFLGTAALGAGIAACQPGIPAFLQSRFGKGVQRASVTFTLGITVGEVVASGTTASVLLGWLGSWQATMVFWGLLLATAVPLWLRGARGRPAGRSRGERWRLRDTLWSWRLWAVYLLFTGQSLVFFSANTWIPTSLRGGASAGTVSLTLAVLNGVMIPVDLVLMLSARNFATRRSYYFASSTITLLGAGGWMVSSARPALLWAALIGIGVALNFAGLLAYPALVAAPHRVAAVSASMLTVGYVGAFAGPFLGGVALDLGGGRNSPFIPIVVAAVVMVACSLVAPVGRDPGDRVAAASAT